MRPVSLSGIILMRHQLTTHVAVLVQNVGMSPHLAQIIGGCIQMMFMFGSILPTFTLNSRGRRKTMMLGCGGLGVCMLMISALLSQADNVGNGQSFASASVTFFFLYMLIFGMSVNCVPWVYVPEILPLHARSQGTAVGISANWLWNFVVVCTLSYSLVLPLRFSYTS